MSNQNNTVKIFGYGSLMSKESLQTTAPNATNLQVAYIKGFRRVFNKLDEEGWTRTDTKEDLGEDVLGVPYCAINLIPALGIARVNGVVFELSPNDLENLKRREVGYGLIETTAYDFSSNRTLGKCLVFSAPECNTPYKKGSPAQDYYLQRCLDAAKEYGDEFYRQFLATTYIGDKTLEEL